MEIKHFEFTTQVCPLCHAELNTFAEFQDHFPPSWHDDKSRRCPAEIAIEKEQTERIRNPGYFVTFTMDPKFSNKELFKKKMLKKFDSSEVKKCTRFWYVFEHEDSNIHCHVYLCPSVRASWFQFSEGSVNKQKAKGSLHQIETYMSKEGELKKLI